jgi:hypothetical protein
VKTQGFIPCLLAACFAVGALPARAEEVQQLAMLAEAEALDSVNCDCDDCCSDAPFWYAGTEVTFLGYRATTGGRITITLNDVTTAGTDVSLVSDRVQDFGYAPRVWFGRQFGEKWGVQARYWTMDDFHTGTPGAPPGFVTLPNFSTETEVGHARLYTIDIEGVRHFTPGRWKLDGTIGARHASFVADTNVTVFGVVTTGNFINLFLANGLKFDGTGATASLLGRRQIGDSHASLVLGARASQLWGRTDSFARVAGAVADSPSAPLVGAATVTRNNAIAEMTIAEFQVGVQWDWELEVLPMNAFFRTAFEYQHWNIDGLPTGGAGFGGTIGDLTTNSFSSASAQGDAHLYGLSIATGFTW